MAPAPPPPPTGPGMGRRVSSFSAYVAAAQGPASSSNTKDHAKPPSPSTSSFSPSNRLSSIVKPPSLAWKRRKDSERSWVELDEQKRNDQGDDPRAGEHAWSDADQDDGKDDEDGTIRFDGGGPGTPSLLKGETRDPNEPLNSSPAQTATFAKASKPFTFGVRRGSQAPKPPTPTLKVQSPAIPPTATASTTDGSALTPEQLAAAERERRAADHRVKMAIRKQEEGLEEIKLKNELRSLERKVRHGMRGWQDRDEGAVPPVPALPMSSSNESGSALGAPVSAKAEEASAGRAAADPFEEEAGLAVPMGGRPRRMSTLSSQSKSYENHHVYVGGPSSYTSGYSTSSGSSVPDASSPAQPPTLPLNLPGTSLGSLSKVRAARPPSLILPSSDKFTALPTSRIPSPGAPLISPIVSPLSHLRNSYLATYTPLPPSDNPPTGPYTPTNRVSLLSSTGEAVSRPEYDRSNYDLPSPVPSDSSVLSVVIDGYTHSSDGHSSDDASDEDGGRDMARMRKKLGVPRYSKDSGVAGSRKSSVPFAFDPDEWRPTSFALPPLAEEPTPSMFPTPPSNKNKRMSGIALPRGPDFWEGEVPESAGTFPRKMSRVEQAAGAVAAAERPRSSGSKLGRARSANRRSRGTRGGADGGASGDDRAWSEVGADHEKLEWTGGDEEQGDGDYDGEEVLGWSRRLAHLTILFPFAMLGLLVVSRSASCFDRLNKRSLIHLPSPHFLRLSPQRIGISQLGSYAGNSVPALLWTQAVGCAMFGLGLGRRDELRYLYPPLFTGFVVGFAQTIETFSGWMLQSFLAFSNFDEFSRTRLEDVRLPLLSLLPFFSSLHLCRPC